MAVNRNQLMPQLQECERVILPSVTIARVAFDQAFLAEGHIRVAPHPHDLVGMKAKEQGATPARIVVRVEAHLKATGLLTHSGHAGGGVATPVAPIARVKSWANQAVHSGKGHLPLPQDAAPNVTKSWSILTAPAVIGNPTALGLTFSPTPSSHRGLAPNGGAFAHPNGGSNTAGSAEATPSAQREHDDKKAGVEPVMGEDYSPLRPPSPDSNAGLQGTRISASSDLLDGPEATLADSYSDPWQPTPETNGRRPKLGFLKAIMKIRALWRF
jgi:hypothetical protein